MLSFILRRLAIAIPTLFVIVTISFFLMRVAPGGPFDLEQPLEAKVMENLRRIYQLDRPLYQQYLTYLAALIRGDFGPSFYFRDFSIAELFAQGLPVSMRLGASALALALLIGAPLGVLAAFRQNQHADHAVMGFATAGITSPNFVVAPVLQIVFGLMLAWLPVGGWNGGAARNTILPIVTLALPGTKDGEPFARGERLWAYVTRAKPLNPRVEEALLALARILDAAIPETALTACAGGEAPTADRRYPRVIALTSAVVEVLIVLVAVLFGVRAMREPDEPENAKRGGSSAARP